MQIRAAHATGVNSNQNLVWLRTGNGYFLETQRLLRFFQQHREHCLRQLHTPSIQAIGFNNGSAIPDHAPKKHLRLRLSKESMSASALPALLDIAFRPWQVEPFRRPKPAGSAAVRVRLANALDENRRDCQSRVLKGANSI